jgi:ubiquinone/menaquinone biosynthesis C-methylase UbiE
MMNWGHGALTIWGLTYAAIQPNFTILDLGCGGGKTVNRLAQQVPQGKVYGLDHSTDMVAYAKKVNRKFVEQNRVEISEASVEKTGFSSDFFDLVTAVETYYFWPSLPDAFTEVLRVLKPNGKLLMINEMVKDGVYEVKKAELISKAHVQLYGLDEMCGMLRSAGFVEVEVFRKENSPWNAIAAQKPAP